MNITNEEMEALNRASEILSKYASQGDLTQETSIIMSEW